MNVIIRSVFRAIPVWVGQLGVADVFCLTNLFDDVGKCLQAFSHAQKKPQSYPHYIQIRASFASADFTHAT